MRINSSDGLLKLESDSLTTIIDLDRVKLIDVKQMDNNSIYIEWNNPSGYYDSLDIHCSSFDDLIYLNLTSFNNSTTVNITKSIDDKQTSNTTLNDLIPGLKYNCFIKTNKINFKSRYSNSSSIYTSKCPSLSLSLSLVSSNIFIFKNQIELKQII
jgi:hypothetical protein